MSRFSSAIAIGRFSESINSTRGESRFLFQPKASGEREFIYQPIAIAERISVPAKSNRRKGIYLPTNGYRRNWIFVLTNSNRRKLKTHCWKKKCLRTLQHFERLFKVFKELFHWDRFSVSKSVLKSLKILKYKDTRRTYKFSLVCIHSYLLMHNSNITVNVLD